MKGVFIGIITFAHIKTIEILSKFLVIARKLFFKFCVALPEATPSRFVFRSSLRLSHKRAPRCATITTYSQPLHDKMHEAFLNHHLLIGTLGAIVRPERILDNFSSP